jgi:hypothetical protein
LAQKLSAEDRIQAGVVGAEIHAGKAPDLGKPFVLPLGSTVADLARNIHRDLPDRMKFARLWGHSRFAGQHVHKTELLRDRDIVEIHE